MFGLQLGSPGCTLQFRPLRVPRRSAQSWSGACPARPLVLPHPCLASSTHRPHGKLVGPSRFLWDLSWVIYRPLPQFTLLEWEEGRRNRLLGAWAPAAPHRGATRVSSCLPSLPRQLKEAGLR